MDNGEAARIVIALRAREIPEQRGLAPARVGFDHNDAPILFTSDVRHLLRVHFVARRCHFTAVGRNVEPHEDVVELERGHVGRRHAQFHEPEGGCVAGGQLLAAPYRPLLHRVHRCLCEGAGRRAITGNGGRGVVTSFHAHTAVVLLVIVRRCSNDGLQPFDHDVRRRPLIGFREQHGLHQTAHAVEPFMAQLSPTGISDGPSQTDVIRLLGTVSVAKRLR